MTESKINRIDFLKTNAALTFGLALGAGSASLAQSYKTAKPIRIGMIGIGGRGQSLLRNILKTENVLIPAACGINKKCVGKSQYWITEAGQPKPEGYSKDEYSYKKLLERDDLDAVIVAT